MRTQVALKKDITPPHATLSMSRRFASEFKGGHPPKVLKKLDAGKDVLPASTFNTEPSVSAAEAPKVSLTNSHSCSNERDVQHTGYTSFILVVVDMVSQFLSQAPVPLAMYLHSIMRGIFCISKFRNA